MSSHYASSGTKHNMYNTLQIMLLNTKCVKQTCMHSDIYATRTALQTTSDSTMMYISRHRTADSILCVIHATQHSVANIQSLQCVNIHRWLSASLQ